MKIKVTPGSSRDEVMFVPEVGNVYWRPWWGAHLHIIWLIFNGHELEYCE